MPVVNLDALELHLSVPNLQVVPGGVGITLDALSLVGSVPDLTLYPGEATIQPDVLTLALSVQDIEVIVPICSLSPRILKFGDIDLDDSKDLTLRITNVGKGTLSGAVSITEGGEYFELKTSDASYSLGQGEYKDFVIRFEMPSGSLPGCYSGKLDTGSAPCDDVDLWGCAQYATTMMYFRYHEGESDEVTVYFRRATLVPYPTDYEVPTTISRTEVKKLKVYKHSLAGPRKRIWVVTAYMTDKDIEEYRWLDLEAFYCDVIYGAGEQFTFRDNFDQSYTVRIIKFGPPQFETRDIIKIRIVLEEDYE